MKKALEYILGFFSKRILGIYRPTIIAVTGSVGKTSTKDAVFTVVSSKYRARSSLKNYNNEIGVPLTIIGAISPNHSMVGWLGVFARAFSLMLSRDPMYPKYLILEMGADHPHDIAYLTRIARPDISVITFIAGVHLEFFKTIERITREKMSITDRMKDGSPVVLNTDNERIIEALPGLRRFRTISFGFSQDAHVKAYGERLRLDSVNPYRLLGMEFTLAAGGETVRVTLPGVISRSQIYAALAAASVGIEVGLSLADIAEALKNFSTPAGRMRMFPGIKETLLVDDTYNASPASAISALLSVSKLPLRENANRWAVFGDMLELGESSATGHRGVGEAAVAHGFHYLVTVGMRARDMARGASEKGMSSQNIFSFDDTLAAGKFVEDRISKGDIILVKGSQGARMERIVKELMAEPLRAKELLVRQDESWG